MSVSPFASATALARLLRRGRLKSRDLLELYLDRVARLNPRLNAVVTLDADGARARADLLDKQAAWGDFAGPLHGLPITVKDTIETAGIRTTSGAKPLSGHVPERNAPALERLTAAGAVVFGKTNTPLYASDIQTSNPLFGATRNPWDPERSPGGSSGGAAAAVAAGLTAFELGSDIGGSIRIPAHCCGVYGHKPSYGVVPFRGHIPGPPGSQADADMAVLGPIARSAGDLARLLEVIAGPLEDRAMAWRLRLPPPRRTELGGYRVAAWLTEPGFPVDGEVSAVLESVVEALRRAGVAVDADARPPFDAAAAFEDYLRLLWPVATATVPDKTFRGFQEAAARFVRDDRSVPARFARYSTASHREWLRAHEAREKLRSLWREFFRRYDVLLCPVSPVAAIPHDAGEDSMARTVSIDGEPRWYWEQIFWVGVMSGMAYLPATAAPAGRTSAGLPVGIQIVGPYLEDRTALDFACRLESVVGGFVPPPGFA